MLRLNMIRTGFLLGISLILAAIIYFFAANWGGLDRITKILLSAGLLVLFYGLSAALSRVRSPFVQHAFLSNMLLVAGCICFGAAVALLGQLYNWHADSYWLYLIWSVPAVLFAWITRYSPFYVIAYTLLHLALWFYFFPAASSFAYSDRAMMYIGLLFAAINLAVLLLTFTERLVSAPLRYISLIVFHASLLLLTSVLGYGMEDTLVNLIWAAAIIAGFYIFIRVRLNKTLLTLNALAASAFAVAKFFELAFSYASILFYVWGLVFVALLLTANVLFFRYLKQLGTQSANTLGESSEQSDVAEKAEHGSEMVSKAVNRLIQITGVLIGSISLIGLVFLASDGLDPELTLYGLSLLFTLPMIAVSRIHPVIRYTLLSIGYVAGLVASVLMNQWGWTALFCLVIAAGWLRTAGRIQLFWTHALLNLGLGLLLTRSLNLPGQQLWITLLILAVLNGLLYAAAPRIRQDFRWIRECTLFHTLLFLLWMTFFEYMSVYVHALVSGLYFIGVTLCVFHFIRKQRTQKAVISLVYWCAFVAFQYYDLLWTLLHKSVTLALIGLVILVITFFAASRQRLQESGTSPGIIKSAPLLTVLVIVLQFGFIGLQTAGSEALLRNGSSVKLELAPVDPRSLLQGDYVVLNYAISTPPQSAGPQDNPGSRSKVKVVLTPDGNGLHRLARFYTEGEPLADGETVINGQLNGHGSIYYGIESYFVPEGTGLEVERSARYAYVRISRQGDALLERLANE
ncbi:GDYXXLXY domain-containing protein [Paenibacillus sp. P96]|uniref:GDYXXLXY domain-containing protein n=1 Tax=Paenibacillus zeirhizosphaerae TaxID=2987519 RepID=A0ABT9FNU6_9BACL|nr:GDYXXLXY domain-containing protein [Paenibacillus sp. P96]MDP4096305.1 GDYXXLXY domain-containing protein [Paenibacillus sp. P96]